MPHAQIGDYVTIARQDRNSDDWYIGSITDEEGRTLEMPLDFLEEGVEYVAEIYDETAATALGLFPDQGGVFLQVGLSLQLFHQFGADQLDGGQGRAKFVRGRGDLRRVESVPLYASLSTSNPRICESFSERRRVSSGGISRTTCPESFSVIRMISSRTSSLITW